MKRIVNFLLVLTILAGITACSGPVGTQSEPQGPTWQEQYELGVRYLSEGNYEEAIIAFTAAIEIDPKRAEAYVGRGDAYVASGDTEANLAAAQADYEMAIELDETNVEAYLGLADIYIRRGDYEKALEILQMGLNKTEQNQDIADKIAEIESGNNTDSSGHIRQRSTYDVNGELVWYHRFTYDEQGREASATSFDGSGAQTGHVDEKYDAQGNNIVSYYYIGPAS